MSKNNYPEWWSELEEIVEQVIRPSLQLDGGDIRLVGFDKTSGVLEIELEGRCAGCPMMEYTLKAGIEAELTTRISAIKQVVAIN